MAGRERLPKVVVLWQGLKLDASVLSVDVEDDDRLADKAEVLFESRTACAAFAEGQELTIELGWEGESAVLFHGLIVKLKADATPEGRERATVTALDPSTKLHREAKTFRYTGGKVSEVIETIVVAYGLEVGKIVCEPDTELTLRAPLAQTNQTDLQFVQARARR
jgi:phage protein D